MVIRAVFLDFDGTILDTKKMAEDALVLTLDELDLDYDKVEAFGLLGTKMRLILNKLGLKKSRIEFGRELFYKHYINGIVKTGARPCVPLKPLYRLKKNFSLIVVSNSDVKFLNAAIDKMKIGDLFDEVYGAENGKSKDDVLADVLAKKGLMAEEAVYVGDRFSDVRFGKKAGMKTVAISNSCSWSSLKELWKERPDFVVGNFLELEKVVNSL